MPIEPSTTPPDQRVDEGEGLGSGDWDGRWRAHHNHLKVEQKVVAALVVGLDLVVPLASVRRMLTSGLCVLGIERELDAQASHRKLAN